VLLLNLWDYFQVVHVSGARVGEMEIVHVEYRCSERGRSLFSMGLDSLFSNVGWSLASFLRSVIKL
jgi:hypothetical protein